MIQWVVLAALVVAVIWAIAIYNRLVKLRNMSEEGWSGIDVQLKRRADLVPNLVETVKGYAGQERQVLTRVTELRNRSLAAGSVAEHNATEGALSRALANLFAVAEAYPELKSNENFRELQDDLDKLETELQQARRYYNGTVRNLNIAVESFPSNLVARLFGFGKAEFFEIEEPDDRAVPQVDFAAR
jgi:LemA protein